MAKPIPEHDLKAIEALIAGHPAGLNVQSIADALEVKNIPRRTLQYHLKYLAENGRLVTTGKGRWIKYLPNPAHRIPKGDQKSEVLEIPPLSNEGKDIKNIVGKPLITRKRVGYRRNFLDSYRPNKSAYLSLEERARLKSIGTVVSGAQPAGTYARKILDRLLIDLSWNSSRLEGNTYSLLDTQRLIEFGQEAQDKQQLDAQMILNHKDAIEFLVSSAQEIGFNRYTILNLHALLANNLLSNPQAAGRLRYIAIGVEQSTFHPLEVPQVLEECFDQVLATASAIADPFEQSFFVMVHLPYLQPFDDVNKRVSRLAANIPLIKSNLIPLAFSDVPRDLYMQAMLGVYELNRIELLRDIYLWSYQHSADRYAAVRQSLGEPDPFRIKHRDGLQHIISEIVRSQLGRKQTSVYIAKWAAEHISKDELNQFVEIAETEILGLHEGNFARYRISPSEFELWYKKWTRGFKDQRI